MLEFIKMFGLGILYTILSPIILLVFLIFVLYSLGNYFVLEVINLSGFFFGKRVTEKTDLDEKLEKMRKGQGAMRRVVEEKEEPKEEVIKPVRVKPRPQVQVNTQPEVEAKPQPEIAPEVEEQASVRMVNSQIENINQIVNDDKDGDTHE